MIIGENQLDFIRYHKGMHDFNYDLVIDWALDNLRKGKESENMIILSSLSKPIDSMVVKPFLSAALHEIGWDEMEEDEAVIELVYACAGEILVGNEIRAHLDFLAKLYEERESLACYGKYGLVYFYRLSWVWRELEEVGSNTCYEGVNENNIELKAKWRAFDWIDEHIHQLK